MALSYQNVTFTFMMVFIEKWSFTQIQDLPINLLNFFNSGTNHLLILALSIIIFMDIKIKLQIGQPTV